MYVKGKNSPKKQGSVKMKDHAGPSTSSFKQKESRTDISQHNEDKEITLPEIKTVNAEKYLQTYSAILRRTKEEGVGMEDLDKLQLELEILLSNSVLRQRMLHAEIDQISAMEETRSRRASLSVAKARRNRKFDERNDSDNADTDNNEDTKEYMNGSRDNDDTEDSMDEYKEITSNRQIPKRMIPLVPPSTAPVPRNDIPCKFWSMVEPYCADITADDIKFLEDLIRSYELYEKEDFKKIPLLGTHYSLRWAEKDSKDKQDDFTKSENDACDDIDVKDIDCLVAKNSVPGPMVQRLVSALVEENVPSSSGSSKRSRVDKETDENFGQPIIKKPKDSGLNGFISTNGDFNEMEQSYRKLPFFHTSQCFEKKVRKELEAIGFLDPTNETNQDDSDEVLTELKRCHEELSTIAVKNKKILQHLLQICKTEFRRQQIKNQLKVVNSELADINMKNISLKLKKKHLCKKEAEDAWKLLKEREALLMKLEEIS